MNHKITDQTTESHNTVDMSASSHPTEEWEGWDDLRIKLRTLSSYEREAAVRLFVRSLIEKAERRGREAGISEAVALSDRIEMENPTEFNEWRAFKGFRNALRDLLTPPQGS